MKNKQRVATLVLLVGVVFVVGVLLGDAWSSFRSDSVSKVLKSAELSAESFLVEQELFSSFGTDCDLAKKRLSSLSSDLWSLGKTLGASDAQARLGVDDYAFLKKKYHLMQTRTYILYKRLNDDCSSQNVILFFFSRGDVLSERQGLILDSLVNSRGVVVFAIEPAFARELRFLEDYYQVSQTPSLVVNFEDKFVGLAEESDIVPLLNG